MAGESESRLAQRVLMNGEQGGIFEDFGLGLLDMIERTLQEEWETHDGVDGHVSQGHVAVDQVTVDLHRPRVAPSTWRMSRHHLTEVIWRFSFGVENRDLTAGTFAGDVGQSGIMMVEEMEELQKGVPGIDVGVLDIPHVAGTTD